MVSNPDSPRLCGEPCRIWECPLCHAQVTQTQEDILSNGVPWCGREHLGETESIPMDLIPLPDLSEHGGVYAMFDRIVHLAFDDENGEYAPDQEISGADFVGEVANMLEPIARGFYPPQKGPPAEKEGSDG
jgi:hypothetical protein